MDSELLMKFICYFPDYLSALSRTLSRYFWTTSVETVVYFFVKLTSSYALAKQRIENCSGPFLLTNQTGEGDRFYQIFFSEAGVRFSKVPVTYRAR